jgi:hypothetical protein
MGRLEHYWNMDVVAGLKAEATGRNPVEKGWICLKRRGLQAEAFNHVKRIYEKFFPEFIARRSK